MEKYQKYLRDALFSEKTTVSYRLLSRSLKVHVNQAKEMLYDFHASENARKPRSVHATYIVTGYRQPLLSSPAEGGIDDDENDTVMFDSSLPGTQVATEGEEESAELVRTIELCREEELDATKADFKKVLSIHIYSLEPTPIKDFLILTGCSTEVLIIHRDEDPLKMGATYGTIINPSAKRTGSRAPPPVSEPKKATISVGQERKKEAIQETGEAKLREKDNKEVGTDEKEKKPATRASTLPAKKAASSAPNKLKRGQSNLFSSWGNAPKKSVASLSEPNSAAQTPKEEEEEPVIRMDIIDNGEDDNNDNDNGSDADDEINDEPSPPVHNNSDDIKKRKARDEELRKMMDEEDEDTKMEDDEPQTKVAKIGDSPKDEGPSGTVTDVTTTGGRRRGKRKVMKKVQSRDEDGYLVTKTEAVWESFSEEEPEPLPKLKPKAAVKGKKGAITGQGSIMNFFAKK